MHLDVKDRKILAQLEQNARLPAATIGKATGLAADVVLYRMQKMESSGIIVHHMPYINIHRIGYLDYGLYLSISKFSSATESKFLEYCRKHERMSYVAKTGGGYDFIIGLFASDTLDLHKQIEDMNKHFGEVIERIDILSRISLTHFTRAYLYDTEQRRSLSYFGGELTDVDIDKLDHRLLQALSVDARAKNTALAQQLDVPVSTLISRIKQLEKKGIITGYHTVLSTEHMGFQQYNFLVKLKNNSDEQRIAEFCNQHPHIMWLIKTLGLWDFEIGVEVSNFALLQEIMHELRELSDAIVSIDFVALFTTVKYTQYPF